MANIHFVIKRTLVFLFNFALLLGPPAAASQDLVPVSDITGGASVFVFRQRGGVATPRFIGRPKPAPNRAERLETTRRIARQYQLIAKAAPKRIRTAPVTPDDPRLPSVPMMPKDQAAKIFAGVGEYYMDQKDYNRAIDFFREAVSLDAANVSARSGLSEALAFKGNELLASDDAATSRTFFEEAVKYNPKNSAAYFGLGEILAQKDNRVEAIANYEKARANDRDMTEILLPLGILYYRQGDIAKADAALSQIVQKQPDQASAQFYLGMVRFSQNRNQEALEAFRKASALDPSMAEAFFQAGETLVRLNKNAEAAAEYNKAVAARSNYFEAWFGLGSVYLLMDKSAEAAEAFKKAVRLDNTSIDAYINLGDAYRLSGNFNDAEASYNLATTFMERTAGYNQQDIADTYGKIGYSIARQCAINMRRAVPCRWPVAVAALEKASTISRDNIDYANLGWAYYNAAKADINNKKPELARPKLEKAKENLQKAAFSSPKYIEAPLLNLGMTLTDLGDYAGAVDAFTRVIAKQPKWLFAVNELGIAYRKQNNLDKAIEQFQMAVKADPKYAAAQYNLGESQFQKGNLAEAKRQYAKLIAMGEARLAEQLSIVSGGAVRR